MQRLAAGRGNHDPLGAAALSRIVADASMCQHACAGSAVGELPGEFRPVEAAEDGGPQARRCLQSARPPIASRTANQRQFTHDRIYGAGVLRVGRVLACGRKVDAAERRTESS